MCRYACDLEPMLKAVGGEEQMDKLIDIDQSV